MPGTPSPNPLLIRQLRKSYGDVVAVDGLDLEVRAGECFGLLGPNGAGKTTTIEICEGLHDADAGEVEVLGRRWATTTARSASGSASRSRRRSSPRSSRSRRRCACSAASTARAATVGRGDRRSCSSTRSATRASGKLSGGQKQRLALACALVGDPELLFLDEPTTGLDPQSRRQLWDLIDRASRRAAARIVLTTHYMDEAERLCDRVAIVDHGKVIALGTPRELIASLGAEHVVEFAVPTARTLDDGRRSRRARRRQRRARARTATGSSQVDRAARGAAGAARASCASAGRAALASSRTHSRHARGRLRLAHREAAAR